MADSNIFGDSFGFQNMRPEGQDLAEVESALLVNIKF